MTRHLRQFEIISNKFDSGEKLTSYETKFLELYKDDYFVYLKWRDYIKI